ncbi:uncharacterized protein [Palaemon carinicauda]|uniref:uncharacterized protein n=1 Tax=Palaemon carinicauda TaxID=392227 RepID=UPI0035B691BC
MAVASPLTNLFFLHNLGSNICFLVDTGVCHSLLPRSPVILRLLMFPNGSSIPTHRYDMLTLSFGDAKYQWNFLVHDVTLPLLGVDCLAHFQLLVNVANQHLVTAAFTHHIFITCSLQSHSPHQHAYGHLLTVYYHDVFWPELHQSPTVPIKHGIYRHIKTTGSPVSARFRHLLAAKCSVDEMKEMGQCQKASSP